jgi:hypothetical protein
LSGFAHGLFKLKLNNFPDRSRWALSIPYLTCHFPKSLSYRKCLINLLFINYFCNAWGFVQVHFPKDLNNFPDQRLTVRGTSTVPYRTETRRYWKKRSRARRYGKVLLSHGTVRYVVWGSYTALPCRCKNNIFWPWFSVISIVFLYSS